MGDGSWDRPGMKGGTLLTEKRAAQEKGEFGGFSGTLETTDCPICQSPPEPDLIFKTSQGIGFWRCPDCKVMYASPRFTQESLWAIYEHESFADDALYEDWSYGHWKRENRNRSYVTQVLKLKLMAAIPMKQ